MPSFTVWEHVGYTVEAESGQAALNAFLNADDTRAFSADVIGREVTDEMGDPVEVSHHPHAIRS